jgi:DNA-binding transcriptional LysR family regulator
MELRDIEYFAVLADHRHFGRAAAALGITQPALSKSLQRLETLLEARLVERSTKAVELTPEGAVLRLRVNELRLSLQSVTKEIKEIGDGRVGTLRIGVGGAISEEFLASAFAKFRETAPRATLSVVVSDNDLMVPALRQGELELLVNYYTTVQAPDVVCEHLYYDDYVVCAATSHRLAKRKRLALADLVGEHWAWADPSLGSQQKLRESFRDAGLPPPHVGLEVRSTVLRLRAVSRSDLLDFTSRAVIEQLASPDVAILPIRELTWRRSVGLLRRKASYVPRSIERLIDILRCSSTDRGAA